MKITLERVDNGWVVKDERSLIRRFVVPDSTFIGQEIILTTMWPSSEEYELVLRKVK